MLIKMLDNLVIINNLRKDVEGLTKIQIIDYFNNKLYNDIYVFAKSIGLENYIELLNFLDATELKISKLKLKRENISDDNLQFFLREGFIDEVQNDINNIEIIRLNIFEDFLHNNEINDLEYTSQIIDVFQENNFIENFNSMYYLTNKGYNFISELISYFYEANTKNHATKNKIIIDGLLNDTNSFNCYEYKNKHYFIKSNKPLSDELFELLIESTCFQLQDFVQNYKNVIFEITKNYLRLKATYIHTRNSQLNQTVEIELKIEKISDNLNVDEIKNILFIRWLTFRHKSPDERLTEWLKRYGIKNTYEAINENIENGNLIEAPLEVQINTLLNIEDLKKIFKSNGIRKTSTLSKSQLVKLYMENSINLDIQQSLQNKRVYLLSFKGINQCENLNKHLPESLKWYYDYAVFFKEIEWNYSNEVSKLEEYLRKI